jgi:hypothetical protein
LQLGIIQESLRAFPEARAAFNQCLSLKTQEYSASLHSQAKAGLERIKGK